VQGLRYGGERGAFRLASGVQTECKKQAMGDLRQYQAKTGTAPYTTGIPRRSPNRNMRPGPGARAAVMRVLADRIQYGGHS
jgi:hypothetical protein